MWGEDLEKAAKHGSYRVCIPAKRARQRTAVSHMVEAFMDDRILVLDERYWAKGISVFCTCRRQANLLANQFNGKLTYLLKIRYKRYEEFNRKAEEVLRILEANGIKDRIHSFYSFIVEEKTKDDPYIPTKTHHIYLPCRRSVLLAKLSIPDLMSV